MADQGPDINTSVSPETVSGASPKPPSPEQVAARAEATGLREAEKREGPGEALQNLAGTEASNYTANQLPDVLNAPDDQAGGPDGRDRDRARAEERQGRLEEYRLLPSEALDAEFQTAQDEVRQAEGMLSQRITDQQRAMYEKRLDNAYAKLSDIRMIRNQRLAESLRQNTPKTEAQKEAERKAKEKANDFATLSAKTSNELESEEATENAKIESLDKLLASTDLSDEQKGVYLEMKTDAEARLAFITDLRSKKGPEEKKKVEEEESKQTEAELEKARRESATPAQLEVLIKTHDARLNDLPQEIRNAQQDYDNAQESEKEEKRNKPLELQREEVVLRDKRKKDQAALDAAREEKRKKSGFKDKRTEENIRQLTVAEYQELDEEGRVKYIKEVGEVVKDVTPKELTNIENAIRKGEGLSVKEMAQYARYMSELFIAGGRKSGDLERIQMLNERYPEMVQTIFDKVLDNREIQRRFKEQFPSNWDRIMKFAKDHPSWILILLALLAAPAVAAVGAPAVAMASGKVFSKGLV